LVWKLILPIESRDQKYGKWSPTWEGPYWINQCIPRNAYILETLEGEKFERALNGKYLKIFILAYGWMLEPIIWKEDWFENYSRYKKYHL
jgi:hypothetical protein